MTRGQYFTLFTGPIFHIFHRANISHFSPGQHFRHDFIILSLQADDGGGAADRFHPSVHLQLYLHMRDYQGQVHAEQVPGNGDSVTW